ncbi:DgyrCDS5752 [Dimorphilus gyrociliatus]|uniref:DgyrCDS5752 n=1 Tax=Dimorphilus gyrociliatus TaxID=2664684 RepID=A0A7I8VKX4_9ANNE|nr:DgyrCDS5752 [Dimorphilus gyrociliatus]
MGLCYTSDRATISGDNAVAAAAAATTTTNKKAVKPVAPFFSSSKNDASSEQSGGKLQATVNPQPSETVPLDLSASKGALPLDLSVRKKEEMEEKNVIDRPMGRHLNLPTIALSRPNTAGKMTAPSRIMSKPLAPSSRIGVKTGTLVHKVSPMRHGLPTTTTALPHTTVLQPKPQASGSSSVGDEPPTTALSTAPASKSNFAVRFIASFEKRAAAGAGTKRTASPVLAPLKCGFPLLAKASEQRTNSNDNTATPLSVAPTATPSDENCLSAKRLIPLVTEECKLQKQSAEETVVSNNKVDKAADLAVVTKPTETSVSDASSATKRSDSTPKADESKSITDARRVSCESPSTTPQKRLDVDGKKKKTTSKASRSKRPSVSCSDEEEPKVEVKKGKKVKKEPEEDESDKEYDGEGDEENNDNESGDKKRKPEVRVTRSRNSSPKQAQSPLKKTKKNGSASKHRPPAGRKSKSCAKNETGSSGDEQTSNTTKTSKRRRTSNNNNVTSRRGQARSASSQDDSDASESGVTTRSQCAQNAPKRQSPKKRLSTPPRRNNKQKKKEVSSSESEHEDEDNVSNRTRARKTSKTADKSPKKNISCSRRGTNAATNDSPAKRKRKQKEAGRADSEEDDEGEISSTNASESSPPAKRLRSNANKRESEAVTSSDSEESEAETQRLTRRMTRKREQTEKNREDDDEDGEGNDSDCSRMSPPHTRGRKRRSLLDELHTSEGYVGDETRSKSCDDLYADPSKLGREERALQRAFMQLSEMNGSSSSAGNQKKCSRTPSTGSNKRSVERHQPEATTVQSPSKAKKTPVSPEANKRNEEEKEAKKKRKKKKRKKKVKRLRQSTRLKSRVARGIFAEDSSSDSFVEQDDEDDEDVVMDIKESSSSNSSEEESDEEGTSETSESEENNKRRRQPMLRELRALFPDEIPTRARSSESRDDTSITSAATVSTPRPKKRGRPAASNSRSNTPDARRTKLGKLPTKSARLACSSPSSSHRSETATVTNAASAIPIEIKKLGSLRREAGETPLHKAARKGNEEVVKFCLESDYGDVNARDNAGFTPLHESCLQGFVNITAMLLRHGADVNVASLDGLRPLRDAIESDKVEIVRLLLAYGADLSLLTYSGNDLLDLTQSERMKKLLNGYLRDAYVESNDSALTQQMAKQYAVVLHPKQYGGERVKLRKQRYEKDKKIRKEENELVRKWHERVRRREEMEKRRKEKKKKKAKDEESEESDDEESEEDDWWETDIGQAWTFAGPSSLLDEEAEEGSLNVLDKCPASIDKSDDVIFEFSREPHLNTYHVTVNGVTDNYVLLSDVMSNLGVGKQVEEEEDEFIKLHYTLTTKSMKYEEFIDNVDSRNSVLPPPLPTSTPCSKTKKSNSTITLIKINDALRSIMSIESIVVKAPTTIGNRSRRISTISTQKAVDVRKKKMARQSTTSTTQFSTDSKSDTDRWVDKHFSFAKPAPKITKESPTPSTVPTAVSAFKTVPSPAPFNSVKAPPKQNPTTVSIQSKVTPHSFPLPPTSAMLPPRQPPAVVTTTTQFWATPAPQAPPPPYNTHSLEMYRRNLQSPTPSLGWKSGVASNSAAPWDGGLFNSLSQTSHKTSVSNENPPVEPLPAHRSSSAHHPVSYFPPPPPPPLNGHSTFMGAPPQGAHSSLVTQPAPPPYSALGTSRNVLSAVDPLAAAAAAAAYRTHHDLLPGRMGPTGYGLENAFASCIPPYATAPTFTSGRSTPFQPHYAYRPQY